MKKRTGKDKQQKQNKDCITKEKKAALVLLIYNVILDDNTNFSACQLRNMTLDALELI